MLGERSQAKSTSPQPSIAAQAGPASGRVLSTGLEFLARVARTYIAHGGAANVRLGEFLARGILYNDEGSKNSSYRRPFRKAKFQNLAASFHGLEGLSPKCNDNIAVTT